MKKRAIAIIFALFMTATFAKTTTVFAKEFTNSSATENVEEEFSADKTITYEVDKQYTSLTFVIECEKAGDYSGRVVNGKNIFKCDQVDETHLTCTATKVERGTIEVQLHNNDGSGSIGQASVKMSMSTSSSTSTVDNISVGEDLADLDLHFEDNVLKGSWADTSLGNILIKVVNVDSSETLMNQTIDGTSFECDIPNYTKNIMVTIVPASSAQVEGAGKSVVLEVKDSANADVTFEDTDYTNKDSISVTAKTYDTYSVVVVDNDANIFTADSKSAGTTEYDIPLPNEGENNIKFYLVDVDGNMYSTAKTIVKDTVGPELTFNAEYDNRSTSAENVDLAGTVKNYETLVVNETPVDVTTDGSFTCNVSLHNGNNEIIFKATDIAGNETITTFNITMVEKKFNFMPLILILLAISAILGYYKIKHKGNKPNKPNRKVKEENHKEISQKKKIPMKVRIEQLKRNKRFANIVSTVLTLAFCYYAFFVALAIAYIGSASMEPTLMTHDLGIANRLAYVKHDVQRGDIVSFNKIVDGKKEVYAKRIIGLPGETISFESGYVLVNGEMIDEPYINSEIETNCQKTFTVPEDCYFVLGDNREISNDSRYWDEPYVNKSDITSKYMFSIPTHLIIDLFY